MKQMLPHNFIIFIRCNAKKYTLVQFCEWPPENKFIFKLFEKLANGGDSFAIYVLAYIQ